ncbi:MAG: CHRD domain-containing protein [bacterium]|nr:CHRD domain-containing protein [bacterium]
MRNKTAILIALLFVGMVILPGFSMSSDGSKKPTMGCGNPAAVFDDWADSDNVAHLCFHQVDEPFKGKKDSEAWARMSYTFCGVPSRFVFNGHGLEREMLYALIASPRIPEGMMMPQSMPTLLGEAMSNGGGNVHIKGALPEEELFPWDLYLVRGDLWEEVILAADEPITWTPACDAQEVCDEGVLLAELSGASAIPSVMTEASGKTIFYDNGSGDQLAFILQAAHIGTVIGAHIHYGAMGSNGPAAATLFNGSDNSGEFLMAGMVLEASLMGDFAGSPVSALVAAMDEGMTYVNIHTETWPAGEIRGQIERIDIGGFCHDDDDDWYNDCDDDCINDCMEEGLEGYPEVSMEVCKDECKDFCADDDSDDECEATVNPEDPYLERFEGIGFDNSCETNEDGIVGGCSLEICAAESLGSTCEELPYQPEGGCLCVDGVCQWSVCPE